MNLVKTDEFSVSQESDKRLTERQRSEPQSQVGLASHKASVSQQTVQRSPCTRGYREVLLQIGIETKAHVEIGRDQEGVVIDSHEGIEYLRLRGTRQEECSFDVYVGGINRVPMYRQFCIKLVCDSLVTPSPPEIAIYAASLGLKCQGW